MSVTMIRSSLIRLMLWLPRLGALVGSAAPAGADAAPPALQHGDDACLVIGLEDVVERLDLERFHRVLFIGGDEHDRRAMRELADVLRQQHAVQRRDVDVEKNGVNLMGLQVFQDVEAVLEAGDDIDIAVFLDQVAEFFLREEFVFHDNGFHEASPTGGVLAS